MNLFNWGKSLKDAGSGISTAAEGIRFALTGDLPPEERIRLEELLLKAVEIEANLREKNIELAIVDAKSPSKFKSGWRPTLAWVGVLGFFLVFLLFPILEWSLNVYIAFNHISFTTEQRLSLSPPEVDGILLLNLLLAMLGLGTFRTAEKITGVTK